MGEQGPLAEMRPDDQGGNLGARAGEVHSSESEHLKLLHPGAVGGQPLEVESGAGVQFQRAQFGFGETG